MADPNSVNQMPQDPFAFWQRVEAHPTFQGLDPATQTRLRFKYFNQAVLHNPAMKTYAQSDPDGMKQKSDNFWASEKAAASKQQIEAQKTLTDIPDSNASVWQKLNAPTIPMAMRALGLPTSQDIPEDHPILKGVAHVAEGLVNPVNAGLAVATAGMEPLMAAAKLAPTAIRGAQAAVSGAFTYQMGKGTLDQAHQAYQLHQQVIAADAAGDPEAAQHYRNARNQAITEAGLGGALTAFTGKAMVREGLSAATNAPDVNEKAQLSNLGYGKDYNFSLADAQKAIANRFRKPFAPDVNNYGDFVKPKTPRGPKGPTLSPEETTGLADTIHSFMGEETKAGLRAGTLDWNKLPMPKGTGKADRANLITALKERVNATATPEQEATTPVEEPKRVARPPAEPVAGPPINVTPEPPAKDAIEPKGQILMPGEQAPQRPMPPVKQEDGSAVLPPKRPYTKPTPEGALQQFAQLDDVRKEFQGRLRAEKDPIKRSTMEEGLQKIQAQKQDALRNFAQYGSRDDLHATLTNIEGEALDKAKRIKNLGSDVMNSMQAQKLEAQLRDPKVSAEDKAAIHESLGHKLTPPVSDWQPSNKESFLSSPTEAMGVFGDARNYFANALRNADVKARVDATRKLIDAHLASDNLSQEQKLEWHNFGYKEVMDEATGSRTGTYEPRNVAFVQTWRDAEGATPSMPKAELAKRTADAKRLSAELKQHLADIKTLRSAKGIPETIHTQELNALTNPPKAMRSKGSLPESPKAELVAHTESVIRDLGNEADLTHIRNYVNDRTDLSETQRADLYAKSLGAWLEASLKGKSPLDAAYSATKAPARPQGETIPRAPETKVEQAPAPRTEKVIPPPDAKQAISEIAMRGNAPLESRMKLRDSMLAAYNKLLAGGDTHEQAIAKVQAVADKLNGPNRKGLPLKDDPENPYADLIARTHAELDKLKASRAAQPPRAKNPSLDPGHRYAGDLSPIMHEPLERGLSTPTPVGRNAIERLRRVQSIEAIGQVLATRGRENIEAANMGLTHIGDSWGLSWFTDPETGTTLAMEHRDAANSPEAVREHVFESRAKFEAFKKPNAAKALPNANMYSGMPKTIQNIIKRLPENVVSAFSMDPERAVRTVAANVNPALRDTMVKLGVRVATAARETFGSRLGEFDADSSILTIRARGVMERFWHNNRGEVTMDGAGAHELGHAILDKALKNVDMTQGLQFKILTALNKMYPDAVREISSRYEMAPEYWKSLAHHEAFAHSFMHYYMGKAGDSIKFNDLLDKLLEPEDAAAVKNLQGLGKDFKPGSGSYRLQDIAYNTAVNQDHSMGLPPINMLRNLTKTISEEDATRALTREHLGDLKRNTDQLYHELDNWKGKFDSYTKADYVSAQDDLEGNPNAPAHAWAPEDMSKIRQIRDMFKDRVSIIKSMKPEMFQTLIANYWPHLFEGNTGKMAWNNIMAGKKFSGTKGFMQERTYPYASDAVANGAIPLSYNPIDGAMARIHEMDRFIMANHLKEDLKTQGLIKFANGVGRPAGMPADWQTINDPIFQRMGINGIPPGKYWAPKDVAKVMNNYLSPGLRGNKYFDMSREYGNLLNQAQLGMSAFHLTFTATDALMSDMALGFQKMFRPGQRLSGLNNITRALTFRSPMHMYRLGDQMRTEWLEPNSYPALTKLADSAEQSNFGIQQDPFYKNAALKQLKRNWADKDWRMVPSAIKTFYQGMSYPILDHVVPRMKMGVFADMAKSKLDELSAQGVTDHVQISNELNKLADSVDNRMGQMTYDNLFWNKIAKDTLMLGTRSVGWNFGTIRELGGAGLDTFAQAKTLAKGGKPELTSRMAYAFAMPIVAGYIGAIYQYLATGSGPQQATDYFFPKTGALAPGGKPERVSFPSYMKDVFAYYHDTAGTLVNKLHPMFGQLYQMYNNRDFYGTEIVHPADSFMERQGEKVSYLAKSFLPLGYKNFQERQRSTGSSVEAFIQSTIGMTPAPKYLGESAAEQLAYKLAVPHMEQGPLTTAEFQHRQVVDQIRNEYMAGKLSDGDLGNAVAKGRLHPRDVDKIVNESDLNPLQRHFMHLRLDEALSVYKLATPEEKEQLKDQLYRRADTLDDYDEPERSRLEKELEGIN